MHRMTQPKTIHSVLAALALLICPNVASRPAAAQSPGVIHADMDYESSGYVIPAGMAPPSMYQGGVMPVGFFNSGCDSCGPGCDVGCDMGCDMGCGMACGGQRCGVLGCGGLIGKLSNDPCDGMSNLRHLCLFCKGDGCSFCQSIGRGYLLGALASCGPYTDQGICAQRWYDLSLEAVFLGHSGGGISGPLTTEGVAPGVAGDPVPPNIVVLRREDPDAGDDLKAGVRLSGSIIWGPGGNLEATYIGGPEWNSTASVQRPTPILFSFISDFGRDPIGGFDDTDRSIRQRAQSKSRFHTLEMNYRRRTVAPCCRFQGSWLVGLRYVRYDDRFIYSTLGEFDNAVNANLPRFFSSDDKLKNNLFGGQVGFDLWWNIHPGINLGFGAKGAWVQNEIRKQTTLTANSLNPVGTPGIRTVNETIRKGAILGEFEATMIYRLSHSLALRSSYYAMAINDIGFGTTDVSTIDSFINQTPTGQLPFLINSLTVQGVTIGAEYTW